MKLSEHSYMDLVDTVHQNDRCAQCGACIAVCPFNAVISKDFATKEDLEKGQRINIQQSFQLFFPDSCTNCGICFKSCPVINWDLNKAELSIFEKISADILGNYIEIWQARATEKELFYNSQSGGATTAMLHYALDSKLIEAAIVTENNDWSAQPFIAFNKDELIKSQKTQYTQAHMLEAYRYFGNDLQNMRHVGVFTPCQVHGFHTMNKSHRGQRVTASSLLTLGTFCYGTYDMKLLISYIEEKGINREDIEKMEIDQFHFRVYTKQGLLIDEPRDNIYSMLMNSCKFCHDFTNLTTDISVGNIGSEDDYTTIIIRTPKGKEFFDRALNAGYITGKKLSSYDIEKIKKLSIEKIEHGVHEIAESKSEFSQSLLSRTFSGLRNIFRSKPKSEFVLAEDIHSIYILSDAGIPLYSYPPEEKESTLISGVFAALNLLVNSMSRGTQLLQEIEYSNMTVLLENREGLLIALLVKKKSAELKDILVKFSDEIAKKTFLFEKGMIAQSPSEKDVENIVHKYFIEK